ncbi:MAG: DUF2911 domain-containing protein [Acidobacteria bacterium]|nr:DUF2911 domain-containing protein [Acidobacteriota bacterium]
MKRLLTGFIALAVLVGLALPLQAQNNPRGKTELTLKGKTISIEYGRPSLHGRTIADMLGQLKPGQFWRLGADQSTTLVTGTTLHFGSVIVPAGTYSLWAEKISDGTWKLVFNKQHGQWGTQHNPKLDFASVPLREEKTSDSAEMVTIKLIRKGRGGEFSVHWGDLKLVTDFRA